MVFGLVKEAGWQKREILEGDFLEHLQDRVQSLLDQQAVRLAGLQGCLYAAGPGSTLGLRLAALFLRALMELPELSHWKCLQYQNLELALCSLETHEGDFPAEAVAPWRRDRLHHCIRTAGGGFSNNGLPPAEAERRNLPGFLLGRRPGNAADGIAWEAYPHARIPELLGNHPSLLQEVPRPQPYSAEDPTFARWSPERHPAS